MVASKIVKTAAFFVCILFALNFQSLRSAEPLAIKSTAVIDAVKSEDYDWVEALLCGGADINSQDNYGSTPLMWAADKNNKEMAQLLLKYNPDVNIQNSEGHTSLMYAAQQNNKEIASLLLEKGADINIQNSYGESALILAAHKNNKKVLQLLLKSNPNLNIQDCDGRTALMRAAVANNKEIVDLLSSMSTITSPPKSCYLSFEQHDWNGAICQCLLYAIFAKVPAISSATLLKQLFALHPFIKEYFDQGKFTVLINEKSDLVVIIPESLENLTISIPESLKQAEIISENILEAIVDSERKYGFKNLNLINPPFINRVIQKDGAHSSYQTKDLIDHFKSIIDTSNASHPTRFVLDGHGGFCWGTQDALGVVAGIRIDEDKKYNDFDDFLYALSEIGAEFLYILSCYAGGRNLLRIQSEIEKIIACQINESKKYKEKLKEYEQLMKKRMEAEPQKYGTEIDEYRKIFPEPPASSIGIDYPIVIQATSGVPCYGDGKINAMFIKLDTFLQNPAWVLEFGPGVEKPQVTISDVIAALELQDVSSLPSIRMPEKNAFFRSINIGNMEIITESRLIEEGVKSTLGLIAQSKDPDGTIADSAKKKLCEPLKIEIPIKPDIKFIQIFPTDLTDFTFDIQGALVPKFISKLTCVGMHFIGRIRFKSSEANHQSTIQSFIDQGFNIFNVDDAPVECSQCWFIKSLELSAAGRTQNFRKLAIKLRRGTRNEKKEGAYICSYAYINEKGEYIISKEKEEMGIVRSYSEWLLAFLRSPEKKDKKTYEATVHKWFQERIPTQETLTEATGGIEVTAQEKARLLQQKGGAQALKLIEPKFARTPEDLLKMFMAD